MVLAPLTESSQSVVRWLAVTGQPSTCPEAFFALHNLSESGSRQGGRQAHVVQSWWGRRAGPLAAATAAAAKLAWAYLAGGHFLNTFFVEQAAVARTLRRCSPVAVAADSVPPRKELPWGIRTL